MNSNARDTLKAYGVPGPIIDDVLSGDVIVGLSATQIDGVRAMLELFDSNKETLTEWLSEGDRAASIEEARKMVS